MLMKRKWKRGSPSPPYDGGKVRFAAVVNVPWAHYALGGFSVGCGAERRAPFDHLEGESSLANPIRRWVEDGEKGPQKAMV